MPAQNSNVVENLLNTVRDGVQGVRDQGYTNEQIYFTAKLEAKGKKLNCIENGDAKNTTKLLRSYIKAEQPDKVTVEFKTDDGDRVIWSKTFTLPGEGEGLGSAGEQTAPFAGLGQLEVEEMMNRKVEEALAKERQRQESEQQQKELAELREAKTRLEDELEETKTALKSKEGFANTLRIVGGALPGLKHSLAGTPLAGLAGLLSGPDDVPDSTEEGEAIGAILNAQPEDRRTALELLTRYFASLANDKLQAFMDMCEKIEKDESLIGRLLNAAMQWSGKQFDQTRQQPQ